MRNLRTLFDLSSEEIQRIFAITEDLKTKLAAGLREPLLPGRVMGLLFEKPSLRTRASFQAGMVHLGGSSMFLGDDTGFGKRESMADFAQVLSQYVDVICVRAFKQQVVDELAHFASCPVINCLTDDSHPCQALADLYTIRELFGDFEGRTLAYVGDGNNVARSLAVGCNKVGMKLVTVSPPGYELDEKFLDRLKQEVPGAEVTITNDPAEGVKNAAAVYTDVWASMGQEAEQKERRKIFADYQVNTELMSHAPDEAVFMHCLPAHRGDEVTGDVLDSPRSVVIRQAGNRMHVQKGLLAWLLGAMT
jgi:ornithine carbamoyltransferase